MKKLVIIGGGFAGSKIAKKLENKFETTLIDEKDFFEFTPGILRSIIEPKNLCKIEIKHSDYLKNTKFVKDCVVEIRENRVFLKRHDHLKFDYLVISSGSSYKNPIKVNDILIADRGRNLTKYHNRLEKSKKIIIVGGGVVGVEMAAEIVCKYPKKKVKIIQSAEKIILRNHSRSIKLAEKFLEKKGVEIICNEKVVKQNEKNVETHSGKNYECDLLILCTGISPNSDFIERKYLDKRKYVIVNEYLQMNGKENIFVCGDVASINEEKTAQSAEKQADIVIKNLTSKNLEVYNIRKRPMVISLGKYKGIFEYKKFVFGGFIPAFMKWLVERKTMLRYKV